MFSKDRCLFCPFGPVQFDSACLLDRDRLGFDGQTDQKLLRASKLIQQRH